MIPALLVIAGPTAAGKTSLGIQLAKRLDTIIISSDSRQIYREMNIGTAVPSAAELRQIRHYFIGNISIHDYYNASRFEEEVNALLEELFSEKQTVLMVGGSGLYIDAVCRGIDDLPAIDPGLRKKLLQQYHEEGIEALRIQLKRLDPEYYQRADLRNYKRILKALEVSIMTGKPYSSQLTGSNKPRNYRLVEIGITCEREQLYKQINDRVDRMISLGLVEEARKLYPFKGINALNTVGYNELFDYFDEKHSLAEAIRLIKRNTRHYAKRQLSYFARNKQMIWFQAKDVEGIWNYIQEKIHANESASKTF